jgi:predicted lipid-binding transport protein (Tim44 family)
MWRPVGTAEQRPVKNHLRALLVMVRIRIETASPRLVKLAALAALVAALAVLLLPDVAFARGGGGGHAGGGGGGIHVGGGGGIGGGGGGIGGGGIGGGGIGGGGIGGGFSGGGFILPLLFWGGGGLVTLFVVLYLLSMLANSRRGVPSFGEPQPAGWSGVPVRVDHSATAHLDPEPGLHAIEAADPAFDRTEFLGRVRHAFFTLQESWQARDLTRARPFMGRGIYLGWLTQVRQMKALHKVNRMENLAVTDIGFAAAAHRGRYDHITVAIDATAVDYEVDERDGKIIFGDRGQRPFTEYWTFERTAGTTTPAKGLLDQTCPNCGAPAELNEVGECAYCRAAITSGRFDWVLARIDQADQWSVHAAGVYGQGDSGGVDREARSGVAEIQAHDPAFDPDALLERFEMAYFLVQQGLQDGDLDPARPYLEPGLAERWSQDLASLREQHHHLLLENLNIQGVELERAHNGSGRDTVTIRLVSVATRQIVGEDGGRVGGDGSDQRLTERWTLSRPAGTATPEAGGVLAHRCPSCGEPLAVDEVGRCRSCKAPISEGGLDWSIEAVEPPGWWTAAEHARIRVL